MNVDDTRLRAALRALDPATADLSAEQQHHAARALERILTTSSSAGPPGHPRSRGRRLLVAAAVVGAVFVGAATFLQVGDDEQAYASWTPQPRTLSEDEIDAVAPECRRQLRGGSLDLKRARLALAERRGEFVVLLYRTDNPDMSGKCLASNPVGSDDVDMIGAGLTGSSGPTQKAPPRALVEGGFSQFGDASVTDGSVGPDVTGVTVRAGKFTVEASVQDGWYAAWWPGPAFDTEEPPASGRWDPKTIVHYDLTLSDGTVLRDVQPTRPS